MNDDDTQSISSAHSAGSVSLLKIECLYCNKDFQTRSIFNHISVKHRKEFLDNIRGKWIDEAEKGEPLRVWWDTKNDIGEDIVKEVYVCLATNKSFITEERAILHFRKNPALKKKHSKEITELKKDIKLAKEKKLKEREKDPRLVMFKEAQKNNDPDLARALWSNILFDKKVCDYCVSEAKKLHNNLDDEEPMVWKQSTRRQTMTFDDWIAKYDSTTEKMNKLYENKCLDVMELLGIQLFFWNFWGVQIPENVPFLGSKLSYTNDDSLVRNRVDFSDIFQYVYRNGRADSDLKKQLDDMPKVEF